MVAIHIFEFYEQNRSFLMYNLTSLELKWKRSPIYIGGTSVTSSVNPFYIIFVSI